MSTGSVQYLESQKLEDAAKKLDTCVQQYNEIMQKISTTTNELLSSWYGEGRKEFEKDYTTIYQQLSDIGDIMLDLYDSLIDSDAKYIQADEDIAKSMTMGG